eukprot:5412774-Amphidinium_carterae.1
MPTAASRTNLGTRLKRKQESSRHASHIVWLGGWKNSRKLIELYFEVISVVGVCVVPCRARKDKFADIHHYYCSLSSCNIELLRIWLSLAITMVSTQVLLSALPVSSCCHRSTA